MQHPMRESTAATWVALTLAASPALGWHFESRFVERVGTTDMVLPGNIIDARNGEVRRLRLQFGMFDDEDGPAPTPGLGGWWNGTLTVSGPSENSVERRTPGRLTPFNFEDMGGRANGVPVEDPFDALTEIYASMAVISPSWGCIDTDGDGVPDAPAPMPPPPSPGLNTFQSVYSFSIDPRDVGGTSYTVLVGGDLWQRAEWRLVGNPQPPNCETGEPGLVTYASVPGEARPITGMLVVVVPCPAGIVPLGIGCVLLLGRRRLASR